MSEVGSGPGDRRVHVMSSEAGSDGTRSSKWMCASRFCSSCDDAFGMLQYLA